VWRAYHLPLSIPRLMPGELCKLGIAPGKLGLSQ
jgi:hypothetical protein